MKWELLQLDTTPLVSTICLLDNTAFDQISWALEWPGKEAKVTLYCMRNPWFSLRLQGKI